MEEAWLSSSCCDDCVEELGMSSLTIACSMAGRTLAVFSCLLRSDFAPLGEFLASVNQHLLIEK
jgi:hypothetical protein